MTLLTKIENGQFGAVAAVAPVDVAPLVVNQLEYLADFMAAKQLRLTTDLRACLLPLPTALADSLVLNLLQNAVKHNLPGGELYVRTDPTGLLVRNTGPAPSVDPTHFLERFRKHDPTTESAGLGLAIVAQICRVYGLTLTYTFVPADAQHELRVVRGGPI